MVYHFICLGIQCEWLHKKLMFPRIFQVFTKCLWFYNNKPLVSTQKKNTTMILVSTSILGLIFNALPKITEK